MYLVIKIIGLLALILVQSHQFHPYFLVEPRTPFIGLILLFLFTLLELFFYKFWAQNRSIPSRFYLLFRAAFFSLAFASLFPKEFPFGYFPSIYWIYGFFITTPIVLAIPLLSLSKQKLPALIGLFVSDLLLVTIVSTKWLSFSLDSLKPMDVFFQTIVLLLLHFLWKVYKNWFQTSNPPNTLAD